MEDGTFWVFGGSMVVGTCTFDAHGKSFNKLRAGSGMGEMMRFTQQIEALYETIASGEMPDDYPNNPAEFFDFAARPYIILDRD